MGLPELVALMPVLDELCFEVDDKHIISVNANTFVADYDGFLLVFSTLVLKQIKVTVSDIKLVLPVDKIPRILIRIMDTDTKQIVSEFLHSLVGQHVEVILITKDVLNVCNPYHRSLFPRQSSYLRRECLEKMSL